MVFSSTIFLFLFLPLVLTIYHLSQKQYRNLILLLASLIFYAWGEKEFILLMILSMVFNYFFAITIHGLKNNKQKKQATLFFILALSFNLGLLVYFKYAYFITSIFTVNIAQIHLPIGISFFTFQALSYIIDAYKGKVEVQKNLTNVCLYIALFPQLIAGPIVRYHQIAQELIQRQINLNKFYEGVYRFILGLGKKVLIANTVGEVADEIFRLNPGQITFSMSWLAVLCYSLQIYFDFSGYSDMAIGLGRMFGFTFLENFNFPYISQSIREFWRRWHISLSTWFRDYVYIPIGGNKVNSYLTYLNLLTVFILCGFWHGASWTFLIWGLWHGLFLVFERIGLETLLQRTFRPIRHIYTLFIVIIGWVLFRSDTFSYAMDFLKIMFGFSQTGDSQYYLQQYLNTELILILSLGILFSLPVSFYFNKFKNKAMLALQNKQMIKWVHFILLLLFNLILLSILALSSISIASGTYNPFIYFRF